MLKINERNFKKGFINFQHTIQGSCEITLEVPISRSGDYEYIMNLYNHNHSKFEITYGNLLVSGCFIKSIENYHGCSLLKLEIIGDYIKKEKDIIDKRDEIINLILNKE